MLCPCGKKNINAEQEILRQFLGKQWNSCYNYIEELWNEVGLWS